MKVPFYLEATWNLESGDFRYAKFTIRSYDLLYIAHIETRYKEAFRRHLGGLKGDDGER